MSIAPHSVYPCQGEDKWIAIAATDEEEWQALCSAMDHSEWAEDERFIDAYGRFKHRQELDCLIGEWTKERTAWEAMDVLQRAGVPAGPSSDAEELGSDPQLLERGFFIELPHSEVGPTEMPALPLKYSSTTPRHDRSPIIGEHNHYVLGEIVGLSQEDIKRLMDEEVVL